MKLHRSLAVRLVRPVVHLCTEGDSGGIKSMDSVLETKLPAGEPHLLSKIPEKAVIAVTEENAWAVLVLIGKRGFAWRAGNAKVIEVAVGRMEAVADFTKRHTVCKLTENHTDQVTPGVETLGMSVGSVPS